ncbi:MAG: hypothetical protein QNJ35_12465 [Paracoccaceae bacterium]|nr:hypothetical protein [Paracoccaceae bacterium]
MSDFLVAGLIVLALAALANFGSSGPTSGTCKPSESAWVVICR